MNKRERTLLVVLLALLIAVGGWAGYYFAYRKPMDALEARIARAQEGYGKDSREIELSNAEIEQIFKRNPHLRQWQVISLPDYKPPTDKTRTPEEVAKHLKDVQGTYGSYL